MIRAGDEVRIERAGYKSMLGHRVRYIDLWTLRAMVDYMGPWAVVPYTFPLAELVKADG